MPSNQRTQLVEELRQVDHTYVASRSDYRALQREYNSQRNNLKREWELNTGLTWPETESVVDFQAHIRNGIVTTGEYSGWEITVADDRDGDTGGYYLYLKKSDIESFDYWFEHEAGLQAQLVDFEVEWVV